MNVILRRSCLGGLGLMVCALSMGQAQQRQPKTLNDILGTWRIEFPKEGEDSLVDRMYSVDRRYTFRPDGVWFETIRRRFDADTLACTRKFRYHLSNDTLVSQPWLDDPQDKPWAWQILTAQDTIRSDGYPPIVLQAKQLAVGSKVGYKTEILSKTALDQTPPSDHITPRSPSPVSSKAAALAGTWEQIPGKGSDQIWRGFVRSTLTIWPDLRYVISTTWKDGADTFTCTEGWQWADTLRPAGDTLLFPGDRILLKGEELLFFNYGPPTDSLRRAYKRVGSVPHP